jgi:hypothetical protein
VLVPAGFQGLYNRKALVGGNKSADHSEGSKTRIQDTEFDGLITRILLDKIVLEKIKTESGIFLKK